MAVTPAAGKKKNMSIFERKPDNDRDAGGGEEKEKERL
jgi:hypothetical protein